jgi:hypothetical protein
LRTLNPLEKLMSELNGPYIIEEIEYIRHAGKESRGSLVFTAAGGEQFAAPMSPNQLKAMLEKLRNELGDP